MYIKKKLKKIINDHVYYIIICFFLILLCVLLSVFISNGGNINDNIIPELIGFSLEGMFFLAIFQIYQKRQETQKNNHLKQLVRSSLNGLFFKLSCIYAFNNPDDKDRLSIVNCDSSEAMSLYAEMVSNKFENLDLFYKDIVEDAHKCSQNIEKMQPLLVSLSPNQAHAWIRLTQSIDQISSSDNPGDCQHELCWFFFTWLPFFDKD